MTRIKEMISRILKAFRAKDRETQQTQEHREPVMYMHWNDFLIEEPALPHWTAKPGRTRAQTGNSQSQAEPVSLYYRYQKLKRKGKGSFWNQA